MSVWTTREGLQIQVCDLTDEHLLNIIRHVLRYHEHKVLESIHTVHVMGLGEGDGGIDEVIEQYSNDPSVETPIFHELVREMRKRELQDEKILSHVEFMEVQRELIGT